VSYGLADDLQINSTDLAGLKYTVIDRDGDGFDDHIDLDSDGDGKSDKVESGLADADIILLDANANGRIDSVVAVGVDGIADAIQGGVDGASLDYVRLDDDNDSVPNSRDLDSDNDGLLDVFESNLLDQNLDGFADGVDADGNGKIDTGNILRVSDKPNTDGDALPNYADLDSDNNGVFDNRETGAAAGLQLLDVNNDGIIDAASDAANDPDDDGIFGEADGLPNKFGSGSLDSDGEMAQMHQTMVTVMTMAYLTVWKMMHLKPLFQVRVVRASYL